MIGRIDDLYFEWMLSKINAFKAKKYTSLLKALSRASFVPLMVQDENRVSDGMDLRFRFSYEEQSNFTMDSPTSILEVMVSLSIYYDTTLSNEDSQEGELFWLMLDNLGLSQMTNNRHNYDLMDYILYNFINREYSKNGKGGLFTTIRDDIDMRDIEIWYQLCIYMEDITA